jgi:phage nucleotide-binding protein
LTDRNLGGLKVAPIQDIPDVLNIMVYGWPGVGKTRLAGSAAAVPELSPVLFVDVEGGTLSLRDHYPLVDTVRVKSWDDIVKLYAELRKGTHGYKTIVLDSLTEIQKFGMFAIMKSVLENDPTRDPDLPSIGEWGKSTEQMRKFVRLFRDLPVNTVFTALVVEDKQKNGTILKRPSLPGKLAAEVAGFLDIVLYMYIKEIDGEQRRLLLSSGSEDVVAKDRTDRLPPVVTTPSLPDIYNTIFGTKEGMTIT